MDSDSTRLLNIPQWPLVANWLFKYKSLLWSNSSLAVYFKIWLFVLVLSSPSYLIKGNATWHCSGPIVNQWEAAEVRLYAGNVLIMLKLKLYLDRWLTWMKFETKISRFVCWKLCISRGQKVKHISIIRFTESLGSLNQLPLRLLMQTLLLL